MMLLQVPAPPAPPPMPPPDVYFPDPGMMPPWVTLPPQVTLLIMLALCAVAGIVLWPIARAIGRRLEGRGAQDTAALQQEVEELRARLAEIESLPNRLGELEERVDFTERLLAQQPAADRLGPARQERL